MSALRELLALHREKEDLIAIGAYAPGSDHRIDRAIELLPSIEGFLKQSVDEPTPSDETDRLLLELAVS